MCGEEQPADEAGKSSNLLGTALLLRYLPQSLTLCSEISDHLLANSWFPSVPKNCVSKEKADSSVTPGLPSRRDLPAPPSSSLGCGPPTSRLHGWVFPRRPEDWCPRSPGWEGILPEQVDTEIVGTQMCSFDLREPGLARGSWPQRARWWCLNPVSLPVW